MACLDTTILLDLGGVGGSVRKDRAERKVADLIHRGETLVITRFSIAELLVGVYRSIDPEKEHETVESVTGDLGILEFDETAARFFASASAHLRDIGRPAPDMDVLIAATALAGGHILVTDNVAHFLNIRQLTVETY